MRGVDHGRGVVGDRPVALVAGGRPGPGLAGREGEQAGPGHAQRGGEVGVVDLAAGHEHARGESLNQPGADHARLQGRGLLPSQFFQNPLRLAAGGQHAEIGGNPAGLGRRRDGGGELALTLAGMDDSLSGLPSSIQLTNPQDYQNHKAAVLSTLLGDAGEALPKDASRAYLVAWQRASFNFPLQLGNHAASNNDLTLLFETFGLS